MDRWYFSCLEFHIRLPTTRQNKSTSKKKIGKETNLCTRQQIKLPIVYTIAEEKKVRKKMKQYYKYVEQHYIRRYVKQNICIQITLVTVDS